MIERLRVQILTGTTGAFSSPELTLCADTSAVSIPSLVTTVADKRPQSFCQKYRWQIIPKQAHTLDPSKSEWADYAAVLAQCGNLSGNELTRNSSESTRSQSSQLAELLLTDPSLKSGISVRELVSTSKKKRRRAMNCRTFSQNPRTRGKSHHYHHHWLGLENKILILL